MDRHRRESFGLAAAVAAVFVFFAQSLPTLAMQSPTFDEVFHTARAYAYIRTGDLRMQQDHPPLVSVLAGLPLLLMPELTPPQQIAHWNDAHLYYFAHALFWELGHDVDKMLFLARFPIVLLGALLGAVVCRWSREAHHSTTAAAVAGLLYAGAPNLLAHTSLVTTDMAITATSFIALYMLWRYLRAPSLRRLLMAGLCAGLAVSAKLSGLLILPAISLLVLWRGRPETSWSVEPEGTCGEPVRGTFNPRRWMGRVFSLGVLIAVAGLVVWAIHGFELRPWSTDGGIPLPAVTYLRNVQALIGHAERGHGAFLAGQVSAHGWWYYFPAVFLLKTPLPMVALLSMAIWDTVRQKRLGGEIPWLLFPVTYFGFAMSSSLNLGYRYILPIDPFLILYVSKLSALPGMRGRKWASGATAALATACLCRTVWLHPHYLAYFNLLAGGPAGGYRYLVDSNLDWGQDLKFLKRYLDERGVEEIWLGYFGTADPSYYGLRYRPLLRPDSSGPAEGFFPLNPTPGWYAISATVLQGVYWPEPDIFDWFRRHKPVATVGYSIFVYHVEKNPVQPKWLGFCYTPEPVFDTGELLRRLGREDLRVVGFDCNQAWVYPSGEGPGWYMIPLASDGSGTLAAEMLGGAEIVYRERGLGVVPGYTLYLWQGETATHIPDLTATAWMSPVLAPNETESDSTLAVPIEVGSLISFLGYRILTTRSHPGGEVILDTLWQVREPPEDPILSVFAHLVSPTGALSVGDSLGVPAVQWQAGDLFLQRNRLHIPDDAVPGAYWVQVGLYSLKTGKRFPVYESGFPVADRLLLTTIDVTNER